MKKLSLAAAAALVLLTTPALAQGNAATDGAPVSINVSTAGLDLSRSADQQVLRARVTKAIANACNPGGTYYADLTLDKSCAAEISAKADLIVQQLASRASESRYVTN